MPRARTRPDTTGLNLRQLETFVKVAEVGSFSKAALILNIAQPALSRQVRLLETELRSNLLVRTGRGVVLTEAGKRLFEHSIGVLHLVARAREDLVASRDEPTGRIVIGLPPSMGRLLTLPLVEAFKRELPKARLAIVEGFSSHLAEWIATGRVDVGLVHNPEAQPAIETTPILREGLCLVSRRTRAAKGRSGENAGAVKLADVADYPLAVPERSHAIRKLLEAQAALAGVKLQIALEVSSVQSMLDLVRAGFGHAVLWRSAVSAFGDGGAAFDVRPVIEPVLTSTLCIAVSAHKPLTPLMKQAQRLLRDLVQRHAATPPAARTTHKKLR